MRWVESWWGPGVGHCFLVYKKLFFVIFTIFVFGFFFLSFATFLVGSFFVDLGGFFCFVCLESVFVFLRGVVVFFCCWVFGGLVVSVSSIGGVLIVSNGVRSS